MQPGRLPGITTVDDQISGRLHPEGQTMEPSTIQANPLVLSWWLVLLRGGHGPHLSAS